MAVAFCPVLFELHKLPSSSPAALQFQLPYRMVFAVATSDSVVLYETGTGGPLCVLGGLHLAQVTDLAWSCNGRFLAVSSFDGYCRWVQIGSSQESC